MCPICSSFLIAGFFLEKKKLYVWTKDNCRRSCNFVIYYAFGDSFRKTLKFFVRANWNGVRSKFLLIDATRQAMLIAGVFGACTL